MGDLLAGAWVGGKSIVVGDDEDDGCGFDVLITAAWSLGENKDFGE